MVKDFFSSNPKYILKVDTFDSMIGVVLSQCSEGDGSFHPCAFFSRCLSPAEQNYVGNWELFLIILALEEWRHKFKGAEQPFVI